MCRNKYGIFYFKFRSELLRIFYSCFIVNGLIYRTYGIF